MSRNMGKGPAGVSATRRATPLRAVSGQPSESSHTEELGLLQARLAQRERIALLQSQMLERAARAKDVRADAARNTIAFRLGQALLQGFGSLDGFRKLPSRLLDVHREIRARRHLPAEMGVVPLGKAQIGRAIEAWEAGGFAAVEGLLASDGADSAKIAGTWAALFHHLKRLDIGAAAQAARRCCAGLTSLTSRRWLGARLLECGAVSDAVEIWSAPDLEATLSNAEWVRLEAAQAMLRLAALRPDLSGPSQPAYAIDPQALLYVAASSLPWHQTGYTLRTHAIASAMAQRGRKVRVLTRPGYPWDRFDLARFPDEEQSCLDTIVYRHLRSPAASLPLDIYAELGADGIAREAEAMGAAAIHAASNHVNALPALIAARRLGVPFHYEMRGIWELSRASRLPGYEQTEAFALATELEGFIAREADRLFVISAELGDHAVREWGVDPERIAIMPNGVDPALGEQPADEAEPGEHFTIGYAGALVAYEGLDLLIAALARLAAGGRKVRLLVMGDGESRPALERQARKAGIAELVEFAGKVPPEQAQARLHGCAMICIPRRPDPVCALIPPLKLREAMALGRAVLVPDLPVFRSEVKDGETGLIFRAGDADDLARCIGEAMDDPQGLVAMGAAARAQTLAMRTWSAILDNCGL